MGGNLYTRKMGERYDALLHHSKALNTELHKLAPLVKQMHLLSSNAVSSAARAGSEGNAFRVLTQDIQLLGNDVSNCITDSHELMNNVNVLAEKLASLFARYLNELNDNAVADEELINAIFQGNKALSYAIHRLVECLEPIGILVKKGEYLAIFASVEAANSGDYEESFEAVSSMLRVLVEELALQSKQQLSLLRELSEGIDLQMEQQFRLKYSD